MSQTVLEALEDFLAAVEPSGIDAVRAELARRLAVAAGVAPPYALPRIAAALEELLAALAAGPEQEADARAAARILRAVDVR